MCLYIKKINDFCHIYLTDSLNNILSVDVTTITSLTDKIKENILKNNVKKINFVNEINFN